MAEAVMFFAEGFEEVEALTAVDLLRRAGVSVAMISVGASLTVTGRSGITVVCDSLWDEKTIGGADMVILPGGQPGVDNLRADERVCGAVTAFAREGKEVAAICAAPTLPGSLGLLKGKRAACYPGLEAALTGAAAVTDEEVVRDGNFTTSRGLGTAIPFALELIRVLRGGKTAEAVSRSIVFQCT